MLQDGRVGRSGAASGGGGDPAGGGLWPSRGRSRWSRWFWRYELITTIVIISPCIISSHSSRMNCSVTVVISRSQYCSAKVMSYCPSCSYTSQGVGTTPLLIHGLLVSMGDAHIQVITDDFISSHCLLSVCLVSDVILVLVKLLVPVECVCVCVCGE